jgi:putative ABC transport system substrate-binding protein
MPFDRLLRREFVALFGGAVAWPLGALAQQLKRTRQIGVLMSRLENDPGIQLPIRLFLQALEQLGWVDKQNVAISYRWGGADAAQVGRLASELAQLKPDVILGATTPVVSALQRETRALPIVFVNVSDPVSSGFAKSLARPGGNITGFTDTTEDLTGKWIELLKEIAPPVSRVLGLFNPETIPNSDHLRQFEEAASLRALRATAAPVRSDQDIDDSLATFAREPGGGVVVMSDAFTAVHHGSIIEALLRHRLPAIFWSRFFVAKGGLLSYGANTVDPYRRAASYVDRVLRGTSPGDLPIQRPTKFELIINLKTAKALGLTVPDRLLTLADEAIE